MSAEEELWGSAFVVPCNSNGLRISGLLTPKRYTLSRRSRAIQRRCAVSALLLGYSMSRILIGDDHAMTRAGYKQFLLKENASHQISEAGSAIQVLEHLREHSCDLLLLDLQMPGMSGVNALPTIIESFPRLRVLVVSGLPEKLYARNLLRAGAHGFLSKGSSAEDFMDAIHTVLRGHHYVSSHVAQLLVEEIGQDATKPLHARLSNRELEVFLRIAAGMGVSRIAKNLGLNVKTVSTYRSRVLAKLALENNADITAYALRNDLHGDQKSLSRINNCETISESDENAKNNLSLHLAE
jgi:two-component system, NarL family, invasion response regulator UvrY